MLIEVKRSHTVFFHIHLKDLYILLIFSYSAFFVHIVNIFLSSPVTKVHSNDWPHTHHQYLFIYLHIISPWTHSYSLCTLKSYCLYVIHGHLSLSNTTHFFIFSNEANNNFASFCLFVCLVLNDASTLVGR